MVRWALFRRDLELRADEFSASQKGMSRTFHYSFLSSITVQIPYTQAGSCGMGPNTRNVLVLQEPAAIQAMPATRIQTCERTGPTYPPRITMSRGQPWETSPIPLHQRAEPTGRRISLTKSRHLKAWRCGSQAT